MGESNPQRRPAPLPAPLQVLVLQAQGLLTISAQALYELCNIPSHTTLIKLIADLALI